ncbi:hypothetical protein Q7P37_009842 [Cladosporium fusiforme]
MSTLSDVQSGAMQIDGDDYEQWKQGFFPSLDSNLQGDRLSNATDTFPFDSWACSAQDVGLQTHAPAGTAITWETSPSIATYGAEMQNGNLTCDAKPAVGDWCQWGNEVQMENARLRNSVDAYERFVAQEFAGESVTDSRHRRIGELEEQFNEFQRWTAQVSCAINDLKLRQEGLSPLQKQFGYVMSSPAKKGKASSRVRNTESKGTESKRSVHT